MNTTLSCLSNAEVKVTSLHFIDLACWRAWCLDMLMFPLQPTSSYAPPDGLNSWAFFITTEDPPLILPSGRGKWGEYVKVGGSRSWGGGGALPAGRRSALTTELFAIAAGVMKETHTISNRSPAWLQNKMGVHHPMRTPLQEFIDHDANRAERKSSQITKLWRKNISFPVISEKIEEKRED